MMCLKNSGAVVAVVAGGIAASGASAAVITGVSDNDGGDYVVQMGGLSDGATAFSDSSQYSWTGLPSFLDGADYIQTANGDNSNSDLEVFTDLAQPAIFYVFHSDNVDDPDWLTTNFMDTGDDLTLANDGGTPGDGSDDESFTYSIYSASFDGMGSVTVDTFDNDPNTTNSEQMYGLAAVVPAPGAAGLLGIAAFAGVRRRR